MGSLLAVAAAALVLRRRRRGTGNRAHGLVHNDGFDAHADHERVTAFAEGNAELTRLRAARTSAGPNPTLPVDYDEVAQYAAAERGPAAADGEGVTAFAEGNAESTRLRAARTSAGPNPTLPVDYDELAQYAAAERGAAAANGSAYGHVAVYADAEPSFRVPGADDLGDYIVTGAMYGDLTACAVANGATAPPYGEADA